MSNSGNCLGFLIYEVRVPFLAGRACSIFMGSDEKLLAVQVLNVLPSRLQGAGPLFEFLSSLHVTST